MCQWIMSSGMCACGGVPVGQNKHEHTRGNEGFCTVCHVMLYEKPTEIVVPLGEYPSVVVEIDRFGDKKVWRVM